MRAREVLALLGSLSIGSAAAAQSTLNVPGSYATIQAAIAAAVNGDTVLVAPGTYAGPVDFLGKAITVRSGAGPFVTTISGGAGGRVVRFDTGEGPGSVLDGFTVTGGTSVGGGGGGGISCTATGPTIRNCRITGNVASTDGGGLSYFDFGAGSAPPVGPTLVDCTISGNTIQTPLMTLAGGGGIRCRSGIFGFNPSFVPVTFVDCRITGNGAWTLGGGALCQGVTAIFRGCTIRLNFASASSGVDLRDSHALFQNCVVASNGTGGGIAIAPNSFSSNLLLFATNCSISENGIGVGVATGAAATVSNSIVRSTGPAAIGGGGSITVTTSDVTGGTGQPWFGAGCIDVDPMFADPATGDFHLLYGSPCRDAGSNVAPFLPAADFEGDPRISGPLADMGADEFHPHLYVTGSLTPGGAVQIKVAGPPASAVAIFFGSGALSTPTPTVAGDLYLQAPIFGFALPPVSANGLLTVPTTIPAWVTPPAAFYMQALVGLTLTNLSVANVN